MLELGPGTGRLTFALAERGLRVTGVEIAPAMLAQAAAKRAELEPEVAARVELRRGDMTSLDLKRTLRPGGLPLFHPGPCARAAWPGRTPSPPPPATWKPAASRPSTCRCWSSCAGRALRTRTCRCMDQRRLEGGRRLRLYRP